MVTMECVGVSDLEMMGLFAQSPKRYISAPGYGTISGYLACHVCLSCRTSRAMSPASCTGILFGSSNNTRFSSLEETIHAYFCRQSGILRH